MTTAAGRVFMAYLPRNLVWPIVRKELASTASTRAASNLSEDSISSLIEETRANGMAGVTGDFLPGISALAAPIFDHKSRIVAVIGALGRSEELSVEFDGKRASAVKRVAAEISRRLGYSFGTSMQG
jgi:DNA-binding IclR family transcriptional regulator